MYTRNYINTYTPMHTCIHTHIHPCMRAGWQTHRAGWQADPEARSNIYMHIPHQGRAGIYTGLMGACNQNI